MSNESSSKTPFTLPIHFQRGQVLDKHWIHTDIIKRWYSMCTETHGSACNSPSYTRGLTQRPYMLIDTQEACLVRAKADDEYVALSYVWGGVDGLKLGIGNAEELQQRHSLHQPDITALIPTTVLHAIDLTRLMGERYLWVDSMCINQDETNSHKLGEINKMTSIYANASLTIVAAEGTHAKHGLRGIKELRQSIERNTAQELTAFGAYGRMVFRKSNPYSESGELYYKRAWTYQEYLFSKRRMVFCDNSVDFRCSSTQWYEHINNSDGARVPVSLTSRANQRLLSSPSPQPLELLELIDAFNRMQLTYEEDCLAAFAGIASALSLRFGGGFLCGLPEPFFNAALLWQPASDMRRRQPKETQKSGLLPRSEYLPSWSWAGWAGTLDLKSWDSPSDFVKTSASSLEFCSRETFPITTWYAVKSPLPEGRREIRTTWHDFKNRYRDPQAPLPEGWQRDKMEGNPPAYWHSPPMGFGSHFYSHVSFSSEIVAEEFWYPIPLHQSGTTPILREPVPYLSATVEATILYVGVRRLEQRSRPCVSLEEGNKKWAGILQPHCCSDLSPNNWSNQQPLELIAISKGIARNNMDNLFNELSLEEWLWPERPRDDDLYEFYNVLWIWRCDGICYRRGIGRVLKNAWEQQERTKFEMILG